MGYSFATSALTTCAPKLSWNSKTVSSAALDHWSLPGARARSCLCPREASACNRNRAEEAMWPKLGLLGLGMEASMQRTGCIPSPPPSQASTPSSQHNQPNSSCLNSLPLPKSILVPVEFGWCTSGEGQLSASGIGPNGTSSDTRVLVGALALALVLLGQGKCLASAQWLL